MGGTILGTALFEGGLGGVSVVFFLLNALALWGRFFSSYGGGNRGLRRLVCWGAHGGVTKATKQWVLIERTMLLSFKLLPQCVNSVLQVLSCCCLN